MARLYHAHAGGYQEYLRAVDLLRTAWKNQPEQEDLAVSAIEIAVRIQDFDDAIQTSDDLLAEEQRTPRHKSQATKLRAEALNAYLLSDKNRGDYNWNHVKDAFENELNLPDYEVTHATALVDVYRNPKTNIKNDRSRKTCSRGFDQGHRRARQRAHGLARLASATASAPQNQPEKAKPKPIWPARSSWPSKQPQNPSSATVLITAAAYKIEHQDAKQAMSLLERAMEIAPNDPRPYLMLAELKIAVRTKESTDEAIAILRKGIERIGKSEPNQTVMLNLRYASLLAEQGKLARSRNDPRSDRGNGAANQPAAGQAILKLSAGLVRSQILLARDGPQPAMAHLRDLLDDSDIQVVGQQMPEMMAKGYGVPGPTIFHAWDSSDLALDSVPAGVPHPTHQQRLAGAIRCACPAVGRSGCRRS